jgi:hypothetical protein
MLLPLAERSGHEDAQLEGIRSFKLYRQVSVGVTGRRVDTGALLTVYTVKSRE